MKNSPKNESSILPFNPDEVSVVRLNQAQIAEIFGVSRQAVNRWIKTGKVSTFADGTLDPVKVAKELAKNTDPRRLKNKVFRQLQAETDSLRAQANDQAEEISCLNDQVATTRHRAAFLLRELLEYAAWLNGFANLVTGLDVGSLAVDNATNWETVVQGLFDQAGELAAHAEPGEMLIRSDMTEFADLLDLSTEDGLSVHSESGESHTTCDLNEFANFEVDMAEFADLQAEVAGLEIDMNELADLQVEMDREACPTEAVGCSEPYPDGD